MECKTMKKTSKKNPLKCVAYVRTSSQTNVGEEKDSEKRQLRTIKSYCKNNKMEMVSHFYDANVSGSVAMEARKHFTNAIAYCKENNITTIIVENSDRVARDLVIQETIFMKCKSLDIKIICCDNPTLFDTGNQFIRQLYGAINQHHKDSIVGRLKTARDNKKIENKKKKIKTLTGSGKCEGAPQFYKSNYPRIVMKMKKLRNQERMSLSAISRWIKDNYGIVNKNGAKLDPKQVSRILNYK